MNNSVRNQVISKSKSTQEKWLIFSHSAQLAGAELSLLPLIQDAYNRGISITVCLPEYGPLEELIRMSVNANFMYFKNTSWMSGRFPRLSGPLRLVKIWQESTQLNSLISELGFTLILINSSVCPGPVKTSNRLGINSALIVHECILSNPELKSFIPKKWIIRYLKKNTKSIVAVSQFVSKQIGGAAVHYPDIGNSPISFLQEKERARTEYVSGPLRAVMVGRISQQKGQFDAITAVSDLRKMGIEMYLDLYGPIEPDVLSKLKHRIYKLSLQNHVKFHGPTKNSRKTISGYQISLVLSRHESYGRVTAESIQVGVPVIGYCVEGTKEILENGGGILIMPKRKSLADALRRIILNPEILTTLREECREQVESRKIFGSAKDTVDFLLKEMN